MGSPRYGTAPGKLGQVGHAMMIREIKLDLVRNFFLKLDPPIRQDCALDPYYRVTHPGCLCLEGAVSGLLVNTVLIKGSDVSV